MSEGITKTSKNILKGVIISLIIAIIGILLLTVITNAFELSNGAIKGINQAIKIISIYVGVIYSVKGEKGFLQGLLIGLFFTLFLYLIFLFISGDITIKSFLIDTLCGIAIGLVSGVISVNIKRRN